VKTKEKGGLLVVEMSKIVTLHKEGYSKMQISEKLTSSKTAIHLAVVGVNKFSSF